MWIHPPNLTPDETFYLLALTILMFVVAIALIILTKEKSDE